jgi:hypothetical protein
MAYSAPGKIDELSGSQLDAWNSNLSEMFDRKVADASTEDGPASNRAWLFNPIADGIAGVAEADITWTAFPKIISDNAVTPRQGWQAADADRNRQEEYCEWEVQRDQQGKVVRVTFSCEAPDYYHFLAREAPDLLLSLYHTHVSPDVDLADLVSNGTYDPQNRWNFPQEGGRRGGLMHMGQVNNSFEAAVDLSGIASWPRVDGAGNPVVGEQALIACRRFGSAGRHSDPHIGAQINALVRAGNEVSFADPVGLYIESIDQSDWETPDGSEPADWFSVVRGSSDHMLRVVFESPDADLLLGDVLVGGEPIEFGGQIAEKLQVRIRGIARPAASQAPRLRCQPNILGPQILGLDGAPAHTRIPAQ